MAPGEMFQAASVGRIVHYRLPSGPRRGATRPAMVVSVWSAAVANLQVFTDGQDVAMGYDKMPPLLWVSEVQYGDGEGQWSWPPSVPAVPAASVPPPPTGGKA